jgi:chemotaxis protein methyltransferase CheR
MISKSTEVTERQPRLSESCFGDLAARIQAASGIHLAPAKRLMIETRVRKRLVELGVRSFGEYCRRLDGAGAAQEMVHLLDAVTVNKTDFFREPGHFDYLSGQVLPELSERYGSGLRFPLRVWSAGCSTGEEPYTLAMVLAEHGEAHPGFQFSVVATDLCTKVLEKARTAIYPLDTFAPVPLAFRKKHLMRSKDPRNPVGRISPELRARVEFRRLNFMDQDYGFRNPLDVIFCRNVIIYFDRSTQEALIPRLVACLRVGGYLFMGHSETLNTMHLPVAPAVPTVYRRTA